MADNNHPYSQLHMLSAVNSAEELENFLNLIWRTRKIGLSDAEKSSVRSLLNLPVIDDVDPVLVCIRSFIRKTLHESFVGSDIIKLFPPDLSMHLQSMLMALFEKYRNQWKEEQSMDQVIPMFPPHSTPVSCFGTNGSEACSFIGMESDTSLIQKSWVADACSSESLESVPQLESITWTLGKPNKAETNREAIVCLKLQDISKSPSGEIEVKFRLTRDTVDAAIRSLAYMCNNPSSPDSEPQQKEQSE